MLNFKCFVTFKDGFCNVLHSCSNFHITEPGPNIGMIVGATFGGVIFLIIVIVLVIYLHKRKQGQFILHSITIAN